MSKIALRNTIYSCLDLLNTLGSPQTNYVSIFCYHSLSETPYRFSNSINNFKTHIEYLLSKGPNIGLDELAEISTGNMQIKSNMFMITFDDGYKDNLIVADYLKEKGIKPVLFTMPPSAQVNFDSLGNTFDRLSANDLKELIKKGWEIGSHTKSHTVLTDLDLESQKTEIEQSKKLLEAELGAKVRAFSYPKGKYTPQIEQYVKNAGYTFCFTMDDEILDNNINLLRLPRIGVDNTHSFNIFKKLNSVSSIKFRKFVKSHGYVGL